MKLSVVILAHNEQGSIATTLEELLLVLEEHDIEHEVIVVDDGSSDRTAETVKGVSERHPAVRCMRSPYPLGFGFAVRAGLDSYTGDAVAIVMADGSDDARDLVTYHRLLEAGYECAFGSRFIRGGCAEEYPRLKLVINRIVNLGIQALFRHGYNDTTNAFKAYRRGVIDSVQPLLSNHFNLTVELPLKAVIRGHSYAVVPIRWRNRAQGESKLRLQEMGSRYLFIVLYAFFEHHLSRGDYRRPTLADGDRGRPVAAPVSRAHERLRTERRAH